MGDFDPLFEVADVDSRGWSARRGKGAGTCRGAMTRTLRLVEAVDRCWVGGRLPWLGRSDCIVVWAVEVENNQ